MQKTAKSSLSSKRLLRDLNELYSAPLEYIAAAPYKNDLYCWHANIVGSVDSPYEGVVFHLVLNFPEDYPNKPPKVSLCTKIERQFVYGSKICIDILETFKTNEKSTGWSSSYSISSILLQIQSYLFDKDEYLQMTIQKENAIKDSITSANNYKCECGHDMFLQKPNPTHDNFKFYNSFFIGCLVQFLLGLDKGCDVVKEGILLTDEGMNFFFDEFEKVTCSAVHALKKVKNWTKKTIFVSVVISVYNATKNVLLAFWKFLRTCWELWQRFVEWFTSFYNKLVELVIPPLKKTQKNLNQKLTEFWDFFTSILDFVHLYSTKTFNLIKKPTKKMMKKIDTGLNAAFELIFQNEIVKKTIPEFINSIAQKCYFGYDRIINQTQTIFKVVASKTSNISKAISHQIQSIITKMKCSLEQIQQKFSGFKIKVTDTCMYSYEKMNSNLKRINRKIQRKLNFSIRIISKKFREIKAIVYSIIKIITNPIVSVFQKFKTLVSKKYKYYHYKTEVYLKRKYKKYQKKLKLIKRKFNLILTSISNQINSIVKALQCFTENVFTKLKNQINDAFVTFIRFHDIMILNLSIYCALPLIKYFNSSMEIIVDSFDVHWNLGKKLITKTSELRKTVKWELKKLYIKIKKQFKTQEKYNLNDIPDDSMTEILEFLNLEELKKIENIIPELQTITKSAYLIERRETICYHSKDSFESATLGFGISKKSFSKRDETIIQELHSPLEYLSYYSFYKEKVRLSVWREEFTNWIPLYINKKHGENALRLAEKSIREILETDKFEPSMAVFVLTKLMSSQIVNIMKGDIHCSIKSLEGYFHFHRLLIAFIEKYPKLKKEINKKIEKFLLNPRERLKYNTPNLGDFFALLSVSKYKWHDISTKLIEESFTRNILWILRENSNLFENSKDEEIIKTSLKSTMVSRRFIMFNVYFLIQYGCGNSGRKLNEIAMEYDKRFGHPTLDEKEKLQKATFHIQKINNYEDYFKWKKFKKIKGK
eukprot:gene4544-7928_t